MTSLPLSTPPAQLCLLRLSAIGDISHTLPVVRTLQKAWPQTRITWVIGKLEHSLVHDIPGIEFVVFDKSKGWRGYAELRRAVAGRRFDVLLHMQMSLRASVASLLIPADIRLGFDRTRAKDLQWLFTNARIEHRDREHVIESFFGFTDALGIRERVLAWDIPIPEEARRFARDHLERGKPAFVISPCSSMDYRNWTIEGYAAVGDHVAERHGMQVVLCGGPSAVERRYADGIRQRMKQPVTDLVGKTSLKELLAVLNAAEVVLSPDAGPAHLATAVGTPVIGLYAATNPDRARPYLSADLVINKYPEAACSKYGKEADAVPWGARVRAPGTMSRISPADVIEVVDAIHSGAGRRTSRTGQE